MTNFWTHLVWNHSLYLYLTFELPLCKILCQYINKCEFYRYFPISRDFFTDLVLLFYPQNGNFWTYSALIIANIISYCKRANICGGFNFAMFAVDDFSAKLKPPRSFYNTSVYSYLLLTLVSKFEIREIKTTAKGPHQDNRKILTPRN